MAQKSDQSPIRTVNNDHKLNVGMERAGKKHLGVKMIDFCCVKFDSIVFVVIITKVAVPKGGGGKERRNPKEKLKKKQQTKK